MATDREKIDKKYKWDLTAIYPDSQAFEADFSAAEQQIKDYPRHEATMSKDAPGLYNALCDLVDMQGKIELLWQYAHLSYSLNTADNKAQSMMARVRSLAVSADSASWFVSPTLIRMDGDTVSRFCSEYPDLMRFSRMIDGAQREKPHTLSDDCEKLMARLGDCMGSHSDIRSVLSNSEIKFGRIKGEGGSSVELSEANYLTLLTSSDREVRRRAFKRLYKVYKSYSGTLSVTFNAYVKEKCTLAAARSFENAITASTFRDEVTPKIYDGLIQSVRQNLDTLYDYYDLKREALGLDKLHLYDVYTSTTPSSEKHFSYEEAIDLVLDTVKVFGQEYHSVMTDGLRRRGWVDVYPTKAKRGGAFSSGCPGTEPYILMNYTETYNEVSTLAHEGGHSMHSYFSRKYNEPHNSSYTIFVAEVASTVNELLLAHKRLAESDSVSEKLYILDKIMDTYRATLYRQTMFAEFEKLVYSLVEGGTPLTADVLNREYKALVDDYFGPRVVCDPEISYEWSRIPHFYMNFYVYKYATCISAASAIVKRIENEGDAYVEKYIEFLKCGGSKSPLDSLRVAGIDMEDTSVIDGAIEDFKAAIAEYRRLSSELK